ncbi:ABC transporter permease [Sphingomonas gei]|uniref:ABC transporter permease n=1 Tax=Sphingomonas gei TaxID=1395960 RepID=A0A4S1XAL0_9SPHN|nr:ABC transporter permease [Sphingomonas gei]TGX52723.1 ABC transporter permease [Sphingomonas gei]
MSFGRMLRQTLTVARRDFTATVMTPTFLLFLLSPLLMIGFGVVGSMSATSAAGSGEARQRIVVIASADKAKEIAEVDKQLREAFGRPTRWPALQIEGAGDDVAAQARALIDSSQFEATAVLYGPLDKPRILRRPSGWSDANYLAQLAEQALRAERLGGARALSTPEITVIGHGQATTSGRGQSAYFAALGIFFLTLMLSGQAVGAMAEERSNKVIEVLAAAIPLESVFFGKLLGAFGSALLFVCFWGTLLAQLPRFVPAGVADGLGNLSVAVGPIFPLLFVVYFTMAYMLQSAVFLGVGALASTQREIQMLSLPITIFQFAMLGFASYAGGHPDTWLARAAEIFPFSSPLAMAAHAANSPALWPHALALAWQILWVAITVTVAARLFRRGVLKSGSPKRSKRGDRRTIDTAVS